MAFIEINVMSGRQAVLSLNKTMNTEWYESNMKHNDYSTDFLRVILGNNPYGRYMEDSDLSIEKSVECVAESISKLLTNEKVGIVESLKKNKQVYGILIYSFSDWDSLHFEKRTVTIENILIQSKDYFERKNIASSLLIKFYEWCKSNQINFVVSKISSLDLAVINALERMGFNFVESWIYNKYDLIKHKTKNDSLLHLRPGTENDLDYMLHYSKDAFSSHRFHADKNISYEKSESLYQKWIKSSFEDRNQKILIYDHEGIPSAFMVYYLKDLTSYFNLKFAMWKMALLSPAIKGVGIGTRFFETLLEYHKNEGCDVVDSGLSLRNIISLNLHNKVNFKVTSTLANFHLWI